MGNLCIITTCLIVPNFVMGLYANESDRVNFKALSDVIGSNNMKNMYSVRLASSEDAGRFSSVVEILQRAATQAQAGTPIALPDLLSIKMTAAQSVIGTNQKLVERHLIWSRLIDLVKTHTNQLASNDLRFAASLFAATMPADQESAQQTLETEETRYIKVDTKTSIILNEEADTADNSEEASDDGNGSGEEYDLLSPYQASQDWRASFH